MKDFTTLTGEKPETHRQHYFNKPPYAERHVRWCERTGSELIATFLLDLMLTVHDHWYTQGSIQRN